MPRSSVDLLPSEVKTDLDQRLITGAFSDYVGLSDWLKEQGYEISKSAVHRYGQRFEERCEALRLATVQAQEMQKVLGDDEATVADMSLQMAQGLLFNLMLERGEDLSPKEISLITRALSDSGRATVTLKKHIQTRAEKAADEVVTTAQSVGLSDELAAQIRAKILGIAV